MFLAKSGMLVLDAACGGSASQWALGAERGGRQRLEPLFRATDLGSYWPHDA